MALPFFALARARRLTCHYIESAARSDGPSATGRMMGRIPGVFLYTQYPHWAGARWNYRGSVFDSFAADGPASGGSGNPQSGGRDIGDLSRIRLRPARAPAG